MAPQHATLDLPPDEPDLAPTPGPVGRGLALVMSGGGARAAYQAGVLRGILRRYPAFAPTILTGVSAGAINAAYLANCDTPFPVALEGLEGLWSRIRTEHVFDTSGPSVAQSGLKWARRLLSGGAKGSRRERGLLDIAPLRALLQRELGCEDDIGGIAASVASGRLDAFALTTSSYTTGQDRKSTRLNSSHVK